MMHRRDWPAGPTDPDRHGPGAAVRLARGTYAPLAFALEPIEIVGQVFRLDGWDHLWVDGLDDMRPVSVPLDVLSSWEPVGTFTDYLDENLDDIVSIMEFGGPDLSPTIIVRSCEMMHADDISAGQALAMAIEWSRTLMDLDILEGEFANAMLEADETGLGLAAAAAPRPAGCAS